MAMNVITQPCLWLWLRFGLQTLVQKYECQHQHISFKLLPANLALVTYTTFILRCTNSMQQSCNRPTDLFINGSSLCICACGSYFHCQTAEPIRLKFGMWSPSNWMSINYEPPVSVVMGVVYHRHTHCGKLYHSSIMILPLKDDA